MDACARPRVSAYAVAVEEYRLLLARLSDASPVIHRRRDSFGSAPLAVRGAGALREEAGLLVAASGGVEGEDAAPTPLGGGAVVAGEERHDGEALHGQAEVLADHHGQPGRLGGEGHGDALDLLEVREFDLVELDHVQGEAHGPGDRDRGVVVRGQHLLQVALGDQVARRGPAVAGDEDAVAVGEGEDRGAVRDPGDGGVPGQGARAQQPGAVGRQELGERRGPRREELLPQPPFVIARRHAVPPSPPVRAPPTDSCLDRAPGNPGAARVRHREPSGRGGGATRTSRSLIRWTGQERA
ncbi:hypothetical protein SGRIM128S_00328 [Streptomyces griseomycini]